MSHEELVGLAKTHFSDVSFEYENDAIPVLSPCRFTGSEVRSRPADSWTKTLINSGYYRTSYLKSFAPSKILQIRMRDDDLPLAHVAIAVEGASATSPDIIPLMVANSIIGSFDLTYGGGKVVEKCRLRFKPQERGCSHLSPLSFAHLRLFMSLVAINEG